VESQQQQQVAGLYSSFAQAASARLDGGNGTSTRISAERFDDQGAFLRQQLTRIAVKTYDKRYPELQARLRIPPASEPADPGAAYIVMQSYEGYGQARLITSGSTEMGEVDVGAKERTRPVRWAGLRYSYDLMQIRASLAAGRDLPAKKAAMCRRAVEEMLDHIACFGSPAAGIDYGLLNCPTVTRTAPLSARLSDYDDPDTILEILAQMVSAVHDGTNGEIMPDTLLLPPNAYTALVHKRIPQTGVTVLRFIKDNYPHLTTIDRWYRLSGAGQDTDGKPLDRAIMYRRSDDFLELHEPSPFEQLPVQEVGITYSVPTVASTAGCVIHYPQTVVYTDGV
jgi:hypothetical protein